MRAGHSDAIFHAAHQLGEHLDHYKSFDELRDSFLDFLNSIPFYGTSVVCLDDEVIQEIIPDVTRNLTTYGFTSQADVRASDVSVYPEGTSFACHAGGELLGQVRLKIAGRHNALNALATIAVALEVEIDFQVVANALAEFAGTDRRFQHIAEINDILIVDDYGHHPTEIRAVLSAAKEAWDRRTVVCFQPHRYSRSQLLHEEFSRSFYQADTVLVLPIYAASEEPIPGVTAAAMAAAIKEHGHKDVRTVESLEEAAETLAREARAGDLVMTLGAGDVYKVGPALANRLGADADSDPR